jgi:hypothetical protein
VSTPQLPYSDIVDDPEEKPGKLYETVVEQVDAPSLIIQEEEVMVALASEQDGLAPPVPPQLQVQELPAL